MKLTVALSGSFNVCNAGLFTHTLAPECDTQYAVCGFLVEPVLDVAFAACFNTNAGLADSFGEVSQ